MNLFGNGDINFVTVISVSFLSVEIVVGQLYQCAEHLALNRAIAVLNTGGRGV